MVNSQDSNEPVAWMNVLAGGYKCLTGKPIQGWTPLYTTPPQRKPLTDEEIETVWRQKPRWHAPPIGTTDIEFARAIEKKVRGEE